MNFIHWLYDYQHSSIKYYLKDYQEKARIYLDEYEVEEWDYLPLFDNTFVMDRFLRRE